MTEREFITIHNELMKKDLVRKAWLFATAPLIMGVVEGIGKVYNTNLEILASAFSIAGGVSAGVSLKEAYYPENVQENKYKRWISNLGILLSGIPSLLVKNLTREVTYMIAKPLCS